MGFLGAPTSSRVFLLLLTPRETHLLLGGPLKCAGHAFLWVEALSVGRKKPVSEYQVFTKSEICPGKATSQRRVQRVPFLLGSFRGFWIRFFLRIHPFSFGTFCGVKILPPKEKKTEPGGFLTSSNSCSKNNEVCLRSHRTS